MSINEASSLSRVLEIYPQDEKFVQLLELFRRNVPEIEPVVFFQPNSRLRNLFSDSVTNLHMFAPLSFHFLRFPSTNRRSGCSFIGRAENRKNSRNGIYLSRSRVMSPYNMVLKTDVNDNIVTDNQSKKIWGELEKLSKSSSGLQNATFNIPRQLRSNHVEKLL